MSFNGRYPVKNRKATGLGAVDIVIEGGGGVMRTDPNGLVVKVMTGRLELGMPVSTSVLSGEPAYLYKTSELEVALTAEEISRLTRRDLYPWEVLKLHETFGVFFETHEDFYNSATGESLQPKG